MLTSTYGCPWILELLNASNCLEKHPAVAPSTCLHQFLSVRRPCPTCGINLLVLSLRTLRSQALEEPLQDPYKQGVVRKNRPWMRTVHTTMKKEPYKRGTSTLPHNVFLMMVATTSSAQLLHPIGTIVTSRHKFDTYFPQTSH